MDPSGELVSEFGGIGGGSNRNTTQSVIIGEIPDYAKNTFPGVPTGEISRVLAPRDEQDTEFNGESRSTWKQTGPADATTNCVAFVFEENYWDEDPCDNLEGGYEELSPDEKIQNGDVLVYNDFIKDSDNKTVLSFTHIAKVIGTENGQCTKVESKHWKWLTLEHHPRDVKFLVSDENNKIIWTQYGQNNQNSQINSVNYQMRIYYRKR